MNILKKAKLTSKAQEIRFFFTDVDGTLTNGYTYYSSEGEEFKGFNHRDGTAKLLLKIFDIETGIVTGEDSEIVRRRAEKLGITQCFLGIRDKVECISNFIEKNNLKFDNICYIGDDINDVKLMKLVGLSFATSDANSMVKKVVDFICDAKGGEGAFREAAELLLKLRGHRAKDFSELL